VRVCPCPCPAPVRTQVTGIIDRLRSSFSGDQGNTVLPDQGGVARPEIGPQAPAPAPAPIAAAVPVPVPVPAPAAAAAAAAAAAVPVPVPVPAPAPAPQVQPVPRPTEPATPAPTPGSIEAAPSVAGGGATGQHSVWRGENPEMRSTSPGGASQAKKIYSGSKDENPAIPVSKVPRVQVMDGSAHIFLD
jgi:hypothetical protein